jgi:hypothetical protein
LTSTLGTTFQEHKPGDGEIVRDTEAENHPELQWMVQDMPPVFGLYDMWDSYKKTVRQLPGLTVVATSRDLPGNNVMIPTGDQSSDQVYIWARQNSEEVGKGRLLFNALGHGTQGNREAFMAANDSLIPKLYWENLRWAAGDYQNGCINPADPNFDSEARIDDGSCVTNAIAPTYSTNRRLQLIQSQRVFTLREAGKRRYTVHIRNLEGQVVWKGSLSSGETFNLSTDIQTGLHQITLESEGARHHQRVFIP